MTAVPEQRVSGGAGGDVGALGAFVGAWGDAAWRLGFTLEQEAAWRTVRSPWGWAGEALAAREAVDWLCRGALPEWLRGSGLRLLASRMGRVRPVEGPLRAAAAHEACQEVWGGVRAVEVDLLARYGADGAREIVAVRAARLVAMGACVLTLEVGGGVADPVGCAGDVARCAFLGGRDTGDELVAGLGESRGMAFSVLRPTLQRVHSRVGPLLGRMAAAVGEIDAEVAVELAGGQVGGGQAGARQER